MVPIAYPSLGLCDTKLLRLWQNKEGALVHELVSACAQPRQQVCMCCREDTGVLDGCSQAKQELCETTSLKS